MDRAQELSIYIETLVYHMKMSDQTSCETVSLPEIQVLSFVGKHGRPKMTEIADYLHLGLSNLTAIVDKLVAKRLAGRVRSDEDRRVVMLALTAEGKKVVEKNWEKKYDLARRMLAALGEADRDKLMVLMRKIVGQMNQTMEKR